MPNLNEAFPSNFLKINKNCKHGDIIVFTDEGKIVPQGKDDRGNDRNSLIMTVRVERTEEEKQFNINATNRKAVQELYGPDTSDWVNKPMEVNLTKARDPRKGEMVDSILLVKPSSDNF